MPFTVPTGWREMKDHTSGCYICLTDIPGHTSKNKHSIEYPNRPSTLRPVAHSQELPVPDRPVMNLEDDTEMDLGDREMDVGNTDCDKEYVLPNQENPHLINHGELK
jgi:hypothetical protein